MRATETIAAARRAAEICNACRYCDGYCAVFEVMELRRTFTNADLAYLANLCHGCRNCFYACQYAPPHEFAVNLPMTFSQLRFETYEEFAWPRALGVLFRRNGIVVSLVVALGIATALILALGLPAAEGRFHPHLGAGAFYAVVPWKFMASVAGVTFGMSLVAAGVSVFRFWRDTGDRFSKAVNLRAFWAALCDVMTLRNLGGGGHGCSDYGESFSRARRRFHHLLFYGFALCFAATVIAAVYDHVFAWPAPYPLLSAPVVAGTIGGLGMIAGTAGLAWLRIAGDPEPAARNLRGADNAMLGLLFLVAASGLLLLAFRATAALSALLAIHLGVVISFFLLLPYSRVVHGVYRAAALLRAAVERGGP